MRQRRTSLTFVKKSKLALPTQSPSSNAPKSTVDGHVHFDSVKPPSKSKARLFSLSVVRKISSCIRGSTTTRTASPTIIPTAFSDLSETRTSLRPSNTIRTSLPPMDSGYSDYCGITEPSETTYSLPSSIPIAPVAKSATAPVSSQNRNQYAETTALSDANSKLDNEEYEQKTEIAIRKPEPLSPNDFCGVGTHAPSRVTKDGFQNLVARHAAAARELDPDCPPNDSNGFYQFGTPRHPTNGDNGRLRRIFSESLRRNGSVSSSLTDGRTGMESVWPSKGRGEWDDIQQSIACDALENLEWNEMPHTAASKSKNENFKGGVISPLPTVHSFPLLNQPTGITGESLPMTPLPAAFGRKSQLFSIMWSKKKGGLVLDLDDGEASFETSGGKEWPGGSVLLKAEDWTGQLDDTNIEEEEVLDILDMYMPDADGRDNFNFGASYKRELAPAGFI